MNHWHVLCLQRTSISHWQQKKRISVQDPSAPHSLLNALHQHLTQLLSTLAMNLRSITQHSPITDTALLLLAQCYLAIHSIRWVAEVGFKGVGDLKCNSTWAAGVVHQQCVVALHCGCLHFIDTLQC